MGEEEAEKRASGEALPYPNAKDDVHAMLGRRARLNTTYYLLLAMIVQQTLIPSSLSP